MIHYHGTPIGGPRIDAIRFLSGRHALIPFAHPCDLGAALDVCQSICLDNSAFTYWKQGGEVDVPGYFKWVESIAGHPALDWCLVPDTITGSEADNDELEREWLALQSKAEGVVVWHLHESLERLDRLVSSYRMVALGSSGEWSNPGTSAWWDRMAQAMAVACDSRGVPRAKLHGLRMLDPEVFTRLPLASADSTNAAQNCGPTNRFGMYMPPTSSQRADVIAERIEAHNSSAFWQSQGDQSAFTLGEVA